MGKVVVDQLGFEHDTGIKPLRIISLVPSQTELLFDLGLEADIVGVTKFCIHPEKAKTKALIGGTKNFRFDVIDKLKPDLIIGNKEENYEEGIALLRTKYPVWLSDIVSVEDVLSMIQSIGEITFTQNKSKDIVYSIIKKFNTFLPFRSRRCLYLIWKKPWMAAGANTFINSMLNKIGLVNSTKTSRYPELTDQEISELAPELIFLSSEPYPFKEDHILELQTLVPMAKIILVDGEMFSWYGSRLIKSPAYFNLLRNQLA